MFRALINTPKIKSENTILKIFISYICTPLDKTRTKKSTRLKTMKGLDTIESLSAEASSNLSTNLHINLVKIFVVMLE